MPISSSPILIYGLDLMLLRTRRWMLEQSGYTVLTAERIEDIEAIPIETPVKLIVLCHTLDLARRSKALAVASTRWPGVRNLSMATVSPRPRPSIPGEAMAAVQGPVEFIDIVRSVMTETAPPVRAQVH